MRRLLVLCFAVLAVPAFAQSPSTPKHMIAASHPLAVEAGLSVLREGGSAVDAAIAAEMVLAVIEPQDSGLGGGGFALSYRADDKQVLAWNGRETAPAAAGPDLFLGRDGKPMAYEDAAVGGRAVGVPGAVRMLEALHRAQGRLAWERLFVSAIHLAETGFPVSARLAAAIAADGDRLKRQPAARDYFFLADGKPVPAGHVLVNKPLAETLRAIAAGGADALLKGPIASDIATTVRGDASPGLMTTDDLAAISTKDSAPVCAPYRSMRVCGMGAPSSGGVGVLQVLGLLDHFNMAAMDPGGVGVAHLLLEAEKLSAADQGMFLADAEFVPVPVRGLLDPGYSTVRAQLINPDHAQIPDAGNPDFSDPGMAPALPQPEHGTSEIAVVDDYGNAVTLTSTVQDPFGSRLMVRGFLLNDALMDFSLVPEIDGRKVANRVGGGKRPRSAMAPTLVFAAGGKLRIVTGSEGGKRIIGAVVQLLVHMIDFGQAPQQAVAAPLVLSTGNMAELEANTPAAGLADLLRARGHEVVVGPIDSGQQAILITADGMTGASDPRREGSVGGE